MPKFEITAPDGRRFEITAPDGTTADQALARFKQEIGGQDQGFIPNAGAEWGAGDNFASGVWQGLGDEIKAGAAAFKESVIRGGLPFGEAYSQAKAAYQGARQDYRAENPKMGLATDIAGQAAPWLLAMPLATGATAANVGTGGAKGLLADALAMNAPTLMGRVAQGAALGAPTGAVSGFLNAEGDLGDRAEGALDGSIWGTVLGGAAPVAVEGIAKGVRAASDAVMSRLGQNNQATLAARKVMEALVADGMDTATAAQRVTQMGPEAALMDLGPNTRSLAASVARQPGQARTDIRAFVAGRQEGTRDAATGALDGGQFSRITGLVDNLVPDNFAATKETVQNTRKAVGRGYNDARASGDLVDVAPILKELDEEIGRSKGTIRTGLERIRGLLLDDKGNPEIAIDTLHQAKMAIDDLMGSGEARNSMGNVAKARIREYQQRLVDAIENSGPGGEAYRKARLGTAGQWRLEEALDAGTQFMRKGAMPDVSKFTPEELHHFRVGVAQAIKEKLGGLTVRADATKRLYEIPELETKIRQAFGSDDLFRRYVAGLDTERAMFDSYASVMGNSATAERQAADAALSVDPAPWLGALETIAESPKNPMSYLRAGRDMLSDAGTRLTLPEPVRTQMGGLLTGRDVAPLQQASKGLLMQEMTRRRLAGLLATGGVAASN